MKTLKLLTLFVSIFTLLIVSSCKKDDNTNPDKASMEYNVKTVDIPDAMAQSNDPGAQMARQYIGMLNGMSAYGGMMTPPSKSSHITNLKDGSPEIYVWEVNEGNIHCTFTLTYTETATLYTWKMVLDGTMDGQVFNNFTYISAEEAKDGSYSKITVFDPENNDILTTMSWYEENGSTNFTFEIPEGILLSIIVNADNSGSIELKEWINNHWELSYEANWDSSGHGSWWEYFDGVLSDQGNW